MKDQKICSLSYRVSRKCIWAALAFFVAYSVLQSTAISLRISNQVIIVGLFALLSLHLVLTAKYKELRIVPHRGKQSLFSYCGKIDLLVFAFLAANCFWLFIVPRMNGVSLSMSIRESGMLMLFVLYFPMAMLIRLGEIQFSQIVRVFFWATVVLAATHIGLWFYELGEAGRVKTLLAVTEERFRWLLRTGEIISGWGIVRIVFSNSLLLGVSLLLLFLKKKDVKFPLGIYLLTFILMFAFLSTYLRSLWVGLLFSVMVLLVFSLFEYRRGGKAQSIHMWVIALVMILSVILLDLTVFQGTVLNRVGNTLANETAQSSSEMISSNENVSSSKESASSKENASSSVFDLEKDREGAAVSNQIKSEQVVHLLEQWSKQPILGFGYGSYIESYLRSASDPFLYEMTAFSLLMKTGLLGVLSWLALFFGSFVHACRVTKGRRHLLVAWVSIAVYFLLGIQTNPLLFTANSLSLIMYLILFTVACEKRLANPDGILFLEEGQTLRKG